MAQTCSALAYYYENQVALDREISDDVKWAASETSAIEKEMIALRDRRRQQQRTG